MERSQRANICRKTAIDRELEHLKGCLAAVISPQATGWEPAWAEHPHLRDRVLLENAHSNTYVQTLILPFDFFFH